MQVAGLCQTVLYVMNVELNAVLKHTAIHNITQAVCLLDNTDRQI